MELPFRLRRERASLWFGDRLPMPGTHGFVDMVCVLFSFPVLTLTHPLPSTGSSKGTNDLAF